MRYNYLEGLRGYMALWVFFYHASGFLPQTKTQNKFLSFFSDASLPVIVFIILSGFVTHLLLQKNESYFVFLKRRALRLFPIYLVCLIISLLLLKFSLNTLEQIPFESSKIYGRIKLIETYYNSNKTLNIFSHLTLSHGIFPENRFPFTYTIMGQSWSLTLEWQFYILIPFLYYFLNKKNVVQNGIIIALFVLVALFSRNYITQPSFLPNMIAFFLIGYFSVPLFKKFESSNNKNIFIFLGIIGLLYYFKNWMISCLILIWAITLYFQRNKNIFFDTIFGGRIIQFIGKISYSLYCIHMIVLIVLINVLQKLDIGSDTLYSISVLFGGVIFSLLISHLTYKYIELYFINLGKVKYNSDLTTKI
ncbi:acyltransferase family protein [Flavobacterium procerum]|uniref:Acyltransferase family protein n=1 Tax=Flavobacterium procerum TaxID=1455569 RepID=A0ABV6BLG1_9FLAO